MNFKLNPGGVILGVLGMIALTVAGGGPGAMGGLVGGALLGNFLWAKGQQQRRANCAHQWQPDPKSGDDAVKCPRCGAQGRKAA